MISAAIAQLDNALWACHVHRHHTGSLGSGVQRLPSKIPLPQPWSALQRSFLFRPSRRLRIGRVLESKDSSTTIISTTPYTRSCAPDQGVQCEARKSRTSRFEMRRISPCKTLNQRPQSKSWLSLTKTGAALKLSIVASPSYRFLSDENVGNKFQRRGGWPFPHWASSSLRQKRRKGKAVVVSVSIASHPS